METGIFICIYFTMTITQLEAGNDIKGYITRITQEHSDELKPLVTDMTKILKEHQRNVDPTVASAVIGSAKEISEVLINIKDVILQELDDNIKSIKVDIEGVHQQQKDNMNFALAEVYKAEINIQSTKVQLQQLAKENVRGVDRMLRYLNLVKENWDSAKIEKFLKFEAKQMSQMVDRSLQLLERADKLYSETKISLAEVRAKMEVFNDHILDLSNERSEAHKSRVKAIRLKVYLPCCIIGNIFTCPVCAGILEDQVNKWKNELKSLQSTIAKNSKVISGLVTSVKKNLEFLKNEEEIIAKWSGALHEMKNADWTFEAAEIFGFTEIKVEIVSSLNNLKRAAENYLKRKG